MSLLPRYDDPTPYDLRFKLFGFPVRIHPLFWLLILLVTYVNKPDLLVVRMVAAALSILIHELGHAFLMRWYGGRPNIVLYLMGGYAQEGSRRYDWVKEPEKRLIENLSITLAGPLAPLFVSVLIGAAMWPLGARLTLERAGEMPFLFGFFEVSRAWKGGDLLLAFLAAFVNISILWSFFNLLPILPLDGGRIVEAILRYRNTPRHEEVACWVSIVAALLTIAVSFFTSGRPLESALPNMFILLSFAGLNYRMAQEYRQRGNF